MRTLILVLLCVVVGLLPLTACEFKRISLKELEIENQESTPKEVEVQLTV